MSDALNARAAGLSTHLFSRAELEALAAQGGPEALARALQRDVRLASEVPEGASIWALERGLRRTATRHLRTLIRWGADDAALEVFFASQDRRSLRAMVRGAVQGAPAEARLEGLMPTPGLPERALLELARQPTVAAVVSQLLALGRPEAFALLPFTREAEPALFAIERALLEAWALRATRAARGGDAHLRTFVAERLDLALLAFALLLASGPRDVEPGGCFVVGGRHLTRATFVEAAACETRRQAAVVLERGLEQSPLRALVKHRHEDAAALERAALQYELARERDAARRDPLCSAPLLLFLLRLEAQALDLLRLAWAATLGAPASLTKVDLVTPWS